MGNSKKESFWEILQTKLFHSLLFIYHIWVVNLATPLESNRWTIQKRGLIQESMWEFQNLLNTFGIKASLLTQFLNICKCPAQVRQRILPLWAYLRRFQRQTSAGGSWEILKQNDFGSWKILKQHDHVIFQFRW